MSFIDLWILLYLNIRSSQLQYSLIFLLNKVGANQIALGTDYPFPLGETIPGNTIKKLKSIGTKDTERLFHGTALEWLDLDKKLFI